MRRQPGEPLCERSRHDGHDRRRAMKYMLMIRDDESVILSPAEVHALPQIQAWDAELDARGIRRGGARLRPSSDAATSASAAASCWYPMARSPRPKNKWAASTSSNAQASTRQSRSPPGIRPPPAGQSRSDHSGRSESEGHDTDRPLMTGDGPVGLDVVTAPNGGSRDGHGQRPSHCAITVPESERTELPVRRLNPPGRSRSLA